MKYILTIFLCIFYFLNIAQSQPILDSLDSLNPLYIKEIKRHNKSFLNKRNGDRVQLIFWTNYKNSSITYKNLDTNFSVQDLTLYHRKNSTRGKYTDIITYGLIYDNKYHLKREVNEIGLLYYPSVQSKYLLSCIVKNQIKYIFFIANL